MNDSRKKPTFATKCNRNNNMDRKRIAIYIDIIFCVIFLPLIITLIPVDRWIVKYTSFAILLIVFLYLLYFTYRRLKIPRMLMQGQYLRVILWLLAFVGCAFLISHYPFPENTLRNHSPHEIMRLKHLRLQTVWLLFLVVSGFSLTIELTFELFNQIIYRKDLETEKNRAELSVYKAQINPHFLFNSLNTLYGLIVSKSDRTEQVFVKFTSLLRYMYAQSTNDLIAISQEIEYINHYIELQSMRYNHHTHIEWNYTIDDENILIPPMILITFVENACKYGSSPSKDCTIRIRLNLKSGILDFRTQNAIMKQNKENKKGIGIENCRRRLELLYRNRYQLVTEEKDRNFYVHLTLQLS